MSTTNSNQFAREIRADIEQLARQVASGAVDPELQRRIRERSEIAQKELRDQHGDREFAVPLVREIREEE